MAEVRFSVDSVNSEAKSSATDGEVVLEPEEQVDVETVQQMEMDEPKKKRGAAGGCLSWTMMWVVVGLMAGVSAQEFTVEQYYYTFANFARLEHKSDMSEVLSWVTDWAIPPYLASIEAVFVILPILWLLETKGLKLTVNLLAFLAVLGVSLKVTAKYLDLHYFVIYGGQMVINISRIGLLPAVHRMAVAWFGNRNLSLVCSIAFFSDNLGILSGYLTPHLTLWVLNNDVDKFSAIINNQYLFMSLVPVFFAILSFMVKDAPVDAPSPAEDLRRKAEPTDPSFGAFLKRLAALFQNDFNLILHTFGFSLAFGITMMVFHPIRLTVLFEVQEGKYEDLDLPITTAAIFAGYVGAILGGTLLDKTRQHQGIASGAYLFVFIFHITLSVGIHVKSTTAIFVAYGALSFSFSAYLVSALEYAAEKCYPAHECTTTGVMVAAGYMVSGIFSSYTGTHYLNIEDATLTGYIASALLSIGLLCTAGIEPTYLKRLNAGDDGVY